MGKGVKKNDCIVFIKEVADIVEFLDGLDKWCEEHVGDWITKDQYCVKVSGPGNVNLVSRWIGHGMKIVNDGTLRRF